MATSGTYTFNPSNMDLILEAFERCRIKPSELTRDQITSAYRSINFAMQTWANRGANLWAIDLQTLDLVANQPSYDLPTSTIQLLDVYLSYTDSGGTVTDRLIYPLSRSDYAAIPNKYTSGSPNTFWFDRLSPIPKLYLWQVPSTVTGYSIKYYRTRQLQDANLNGSETLDMPYRFLDACAEDLAARIAQKLRPDMWMALKASAKAAWEEAASADTERVSMFFTPDFTGYYE